MEEYTLTPQALVDQANGYKICSRCEVQKNLTAFILRNNTVKRSYGLYKNRYYESHCKDCESVRKLSRPNRKEEYKAQNLKRCFGLTISEGDAIYARGCEICGLTQGTMKDGRNNLVIDHDHKTGKVRGCLCNACNKALGLFHDDVTKLKAAISYLAKHQ